MIESKLANAARILIIFCLAAAVAAQAQTFVYGDPNGKVGGRPVTAPIQGLDGNLYGTFPDGGNGGGTIYKLTPTGEFSNLHKFCAETNCPDGRNPQQMVLAANGNFYGATVSGGAKCLTYLVCGTIFELTPSGKLTTLYTFCSQTNCADGEEPSALVQGINGNLYGTTYEDGAYSSGTVFEITPAGQLTTLYSFCAQPKCADGWNPTGALLLANDGNFYGTTQLGGAAGWGTLFRITPTGLLTTLYSFCSKSSCADGKYPSAPLIQATDGNLYGTTGGGGATGFGTAFRFSMDGVMTIVYNFCEGACTDGAAASALMQANDGNFYAVDAWNPNTGGNIFQLTPAGSFTALYTFCLGKKFPCPDGYEPSSQLTQTTDGSFYGSALSGGKSSLYCHNNWCGTLYRLSNGLPPFVRPNPVFAKAGQTINILGSKLTGATSVTFNGVSATFAVSSTTDIKAQVPAGATTGTIQVTTPSGKLTSNVAFQVLP